MQGCPRSNVYPIQDFLEVQRLMAKLALSPADALSILKDTLLSFEEADRLLDAIQDVDVPCFLTGFPLV